jgi:hypothetical protein
LGPGRQTHRKLKTAFPKSGRKIGMRELFEDIVKIDGVKGVLVLSPAGRILFQHLTGKLSENSEDRDWRFLVDSIRNMREIDLVYENGRLYIRKTEIGFLVIVTGLEVPIAMVRLNCDIILPAMQTFKTSKGLRRFFKR